jgi:uncharacterized alpha-E superfamily protein
MMRDSGWRFLDLGRRIERAIDTSRALAGVMSGPAGQAEAGLRLALDLTNATSAYLLRYPLELHFTHVLDFVLAERGYPRALLFQFEVIQRHLEALAREVPRAPDATSIAALIERLERLDLSHEMVRRPSRESALSVLLDDVASGLMKLSDQITRIYFTHTASSQSIEFASREITERAIP